MANRCMTGFDRLWYDFWRSLFHGRWVLESHRTLSFDWRSYGTNLRQEQHAVVWQAALSAGPCPLRNGAGENVFVLCFRPCRLPDQSGSSRLGESADLDSLVDPGNRIRNPAQTPIPGAAPGSTPGCR